MKHPMRHLSRNVRKVRRGRKVASRKVTRVVRKLTGDPWTKRRLRELGEWFFEQLLRVMIISAINRVLRCRRAAPGRVMHLRPRPA